MIKQNFTQLRKGISFLLTFSVHILIVQANPTSSLKWNSNIGVYEVFLTQNQAQKLNNVQITIQIPTQNIFVFDVESATEMQWNSQRRDSPKEAPNSDFILFSTPQISNGQGNIKMFSFKIAGVDQNGNLALSTLKNGEFNDEWINIQSKAWIDNSLVEISPQELNKKIPIVSYSNISNKYAQKFSLNTNYLKEEIQICSNWLEKSGQIAFYVYNTNGALVKTANAAVESGAQQFYLQYSDLPNGTYFVKAKFGTWETIINDGFIKIDDLNAVSR